MQFLNSNFLFLEIFMDFINRLSRAVPILIYKQPKQQQNTVPSSIYNYFVTFITDTFYELTRLK